MTTADFKPLSNEDLSKFSQVTQENWRRYSQKLVDLGVYLDNRDKERSSKKANEHAVAKINS